MKNGRKISRRIALGGLAALAAGFLIKPFFSTSSSIAENEDKSDLELMKSAKPLYRIRTLNHTGFYTSDSGERDAVTALNGEYRGICGLLFDSQISGTIPLYRFQKSFGNGERGMEKLISFYTTDETEQEKEAMKRNWDKKMIIGWLFKEQRGGTGPLYRLKRGDGEGYICTMDTKEVNWLSFRGWDYDGILGYLYPGDFYKEENWKRKNNKEQESFKESEF